MDPVTHLAAGALGFQACQRFFPGIRGLLPFCLLVSVFPDVDNFTSWLGPEFYLLHHRGVTHSLVGALILAPLLAGAFKLLNRKVPFPRAALLGFGLIIIHDLLDLCTTYGTQFLLPFSDARLAWDCLFIIDPILLATMAVIIALGWKARPYRSYFGVMGLCWVAVYAVTNASIGQAVEAAYTHRLDRENATYERVMVSPDAFSPIYWKVMVDQGDRWKVGSVNVLSGHETPMDALDKPPASEFQGLAEGNEFVSVWNWFTVYPYAIRTMNGDCTVNDYGDLRFYSTNPVIRNLWRDRLPPFSMTVERTPDGQVKSWRYDRDGRNTSATGRK